jgi:prevent-host-death family protein
LTALLIVLNWSLSGLISSERDAMSVSHDNTIGAYDAKSHFSALLARVEGGEEVTITKHGHPIAKLVPIRHKSTVADREAAIERIKQRRKRLRLRGLKIRDLINEGRR